MDNSGSKTLTTLTEPMALPVGGLLAAGALSLAVKPLIAPPAAPPPAPVYARRPCALSRSDLDSFFVERLSCPPFGGMRHPRSRRDPQYHRMFGQAWQGSTRREISRSSLWTIARVDPGLSTGCSRSAFPFVGDWRDFARQHSESSMQNTESRLTTPWGGDRVVTTSLGLRKQRIWSESGMVAEPEAIKPPITV